MMPVVAIPSVEPAVVGSGVTTLTLLRRGAVGVVSRSQRLSPLRSLTRLPDGPHGLMVRVELSHGPRAVPPRRAIRCVFDLVIRRSLHTFITTLHTSFIRHGMSERMRMRVRVYVCVCVCLGV